MKGVNLMKLIKIIVNIRKSVEKTLKIHDAKKQAVALADRS